nr:hypothetical protein [Sphingomonas solaris]
MLDTLLVAIGRAARVPAHRMAADQRIARLLAGGAQLLSVDRAHHADVQRRHLAFLARRQHDAAEPEPLEQHRDIGLAARQPVHGIGIDDVDTPRRHRCQHRLHAGAVQRRRRLRRVGEARHFVPALSGDFLTAHHQLRLDRLHILLVCRETRIDCAAHHFSSIHAFHT